MITIVMGVSGSGKSTIAQALSRRMEVPYFDADDFHPKANLQKMATGHALNDEDRMPWLEVLWDEMLLWEANGGAVLACSALKEKYREILIGADLKGSERIDIRWVYLNVSQEVLLERLNNRSDHFFPPSLLASQFEALEVPEYALNVDGTRSVEEILDFIFGRLIG